MVITQVSLPGVEIFQSFLSYRFESDKPAQHIRQAGPLIIDHTPSTVLMAEDGRSVLKFIKARSWHEYFKTFWARSRLFKEVKGNQLLAALGVNVARIHEVGVGLVPSGRYRYLGYYLMEDLSARNAVEMLDFFQQQQLTPSQRIEWLDKVIDDLRVMRDAGVVFSDCHLKNVFADLNRGEVVWIDTGVTRYSCNRGRKFARKFNYSIRRFADYHDKTLLLTAEEKRRILALLLPQ